MKYIRSCLFLILSGAFGAVWSQSGASIQELTRRAEAGEVAAQVELGRAYEDGNGVQQNDVEAVQWFRKAAEQGNAPAQNSLGVMYALGRGVERNREEAVRWYRKAAKSGLPKVCTTLPFRTSMVKASMKTLRSLLPS
jgi:uncharacterized protein